MLACLPLLADVFSDQHRELEQYYLSRIRPGHTEARLEERLGTVVPMQARPARTLVAVWPDLQLEELRIEVEPGHFAHALLLTPSAGAKKLMIALGPADRTAETWAGLGEKQEPAPWLAAMLEAGYAVCLPIVVERAKDHPLSESTRGKDRRHILHRLGFVTGRTVIGLEVTQVRGLASALNMPTGLYGEADGAWTALYAAAVDKRFVSLNLVNHADPGETLWREPVDRTVAGFTALPKTTLAEVQLPAATRAIRAGDRLVRVEIEERRNRHYNGLLQFLRTRIADSARVRRNRHRLLTTLPRQAVPRLLADLREIMGPVPEPVKAMNPRVAEFARTDRFTAFDVRLEVLPGVTAIGHLLVPAGAEGKKLPAVVTQHGLGGKPKDLTLQGPEPNAAYNGYAARLAEHGYVVFAPYVVVPIPQAELINPLVRMANLIGAMRTNIEVAKLRQIVNFLESLPYVDRARLAYYGLSYGGYSTIWMGPLEPRFKATVISGHFNDWTPKITNEVERTSYLQHPDEDFYNWNVLNRLTHTELIASFWPRAVMVEFALHDGTTFPAWHEKAWAEVQQVAKAWKAEDRFVRDRFIGIHEIHGVGAFDFLDRWLRPEAPSSREFAHWGEARHIVNANPLTWVRGEFRVGTGSPRFDGLAFHANGGATFQVRYGLTPGGSELGEVWVKASGWTKAPLSPRPADPSRLYYFELRADKDVELIGPRPLGGARFAADFAVAYRP